MPHRSAPPAEPARQETDPATTRGNGTPVPPPEPMDIPRDWLPRGALAPARLPFLVPPQAEVPLPPPTPDDTASIADDGLWIAYTFVLVPRLPDHSLSGTLANDLAAWTKRFCLAWDWRLDRFELKPTYLSLTLGLPPAGRLGH